MVGIHYRWDFIGLSTDTKPTPETSEKVVNGSTFYCSDNSKLYVFCDGTWYERKPLGGGGGGGGSYVAGTGIDITDDTISVDTTTIQEKLTAGSNVSISDNTISATDTTYTAGTGLTLNGTQFSADTTVLATQTDLSSKQNTLTAGSNITISGDTISATDTTYFNFVGTDGTAAGTAGLVPAPATTDAGKFLKADGTWGTTGGSSSYTAGDGIDITNDIISATNTGKARILTEADCNWHATGDVNNRIAAWLLPDGVYVVMHSPVVWFTTSVNYSNVAFVKGTNGVGIPYLLTIDNAGNVTQYTLRSNGSTLNERPILKQSDIINNLTSTSTTAPLSANQGKVLKDLIDGLAISGAGAPTTATVGTVGKLYEDTTNGKLYICTDATGGAYTWEEVGAGGGGGPTVVQTTGTSTTDVMSQNAVTSMVFADPADARRVRIGSGATSSQNETIAIGRNAVADQPGGIAIGGGANGLGAARAKARGSIALGPGSYSQTQGMMDIGSAYDTNYGYNSSNYRLLTGLYDPQSAHDAATKGYVDPTTDSSAPTTATVGRLGQIQIDTTTADAYMCVAVDSVTPSYTWKKINA